MPEKYVAQYKYDGDGCIYFLNAETGKIQKICDVESRNELPDEVDRWFEKISQALGSYRTVRSGKLQKHVESI